MRKYDVFLFDADGTLFDYDQAEAYALKNMFDYYGLIYSDDVRAKYREINSHEWLKYETGEISKDELQVSRFRRFFDYLELNLDPGEFNKKYLNELGKGSFLVDGALDICRFINSFNKKIYIITNGILATQQSRIKHSLIRDYISDFFVSEFVGFQKPQIEYFEYVLSHISYKGKEKILIIGDSLTADILGGINSGIDSCWLNISGAENNTGIRPTYEIKKLAELEGFVDK